MKRLRVIVNNGAGRRCAAQLIADARRQLWGWSADFVVPSSPEETRAACREARADEFEAIVVCGGDGTLAQALPGLVGGDVPVALFPSGTANDLASELGVTADWRHVQTLIDRRQTKRVDLVRVNDRYFATVGGLGLGAALTGRVNDLRSRSALYRKLWAKMKSEMYGLVAGQMILAGASPLRHLVIRAEGFAQELWVSSLFVANQARLGGDIVVAPKARNDDGVFDVTVLALDNKIELMRSMLGAKLGQSFPGNHRFAAKSCRVEALDGEPIPVFGDGELLLESPLLDFELLPRALSIFTGVRPVHLRPVHEVSL